MAIVRCKQGYISEKEKFELLFNRSNMWSVNDIQRYFNFTYKHACDVKNEVVKRYGTVNNKKKVLPEKVFEFLNIDYQHEVQTMKFLIEMENQRHANQK